MRKTNVIFVVHQSFEKIDFFLLTIEKDGFITLIYIEQISNSNS